MRVAEAREAFFALKREVSPSAQTLVKVYQRAYEVTGKTQGVAYWDAAYNALKRYAG